MKKNSIKDYLLNEKVLKIPNFGEFTIVDVILFFVNLLVFPAMFFQMHKTFVRKESADFNPLFVGLQLLGGAPEGMVGAILGEMNDNKQMFYIGIYAMFYNAFMLFFRFFGRNGLIKSLF